MAFHFKRKEPVSKAIRRLGSERVKDALECLKDCHRGEAIHSVRTDIKKVRALLRLVRASIKSKDFRRVTNPLRKAAKRLAGPRDAYVKLKTMTDLRPHFKGQLASPGLRYICTELRSAFDDEMKRFTQEKAVKAVERLLRRVSNELARLKVKGKGWKALSQGVNAAYADGRRSYQLARKDSSPENFHEWRKRAKDLWYQVTLLCPVWPEQMEAIAGELEVLSDYLGDDHDLMMLKQGVRESCVGERDPREVKTLSGLIDERQSELRAKALTLGMRFYAEKPSEFCNRLGGYWATWRKEPTEVRSTH